MRFCSNCGRSISVRVPDGDNRPRYVCDACATVHYQNPKIVAGCIAAWEDAVLLCRRAIEPRCGLWTVPAGFMENGETTPQAAQRETWEEACARVEVQALYAVFNLPHIDQVYLLFRARLYEPSFAPGAESLEVALFKEHEIPWEELAFPVIREGLGMYFADRAAGDYPVRVADIERVDGSLPDYRVALL